MKCNFSATFEFETSQPITEKGISEGGNIKAVIKRALIQTLQNNKNLSWNSFVIVIDRVRETKDINDTSKEKEIYTKNCLECNKEFQTNKSVKKFCSPECKFKNWDKNHPRKVSLSTLKKSNNE